MLKVLVRPCYITLERIGIFEFPTFNFAGRTCETYWTSRELQRPGELFMRSSTVVTQKHVLSIFSLRILTCKLCDHFQGEEQKKLDVLSNEVFVKSLISSGRTVSPF